MGTISNGAAPLVIGVGNRWRRDDGAGPRVLSLLAGDDPPSARTLLCSGEGAALMEAWRGAPSLVLVDAVRAGAEPGTIHRLDPHEAAIPADFFHYSTHAFSIAEAIELARVLGDLPPRVVLYGIEGGDFGAGCALTPRVEEAAREVAARIRRDLAAGAAPADDADSPPEG